MGIYIKGMEMPESCYYCPFSEGQWGQATDEVRKYCLVDGGAMPVDERYVQSNRRNCPLIEIPDFKGNVEATPTIIEAEDGE